MMRNLFWLTDAQMARLRPFFPKSHGRPRVDDLRVSSGIILINRNGLRWHDAPREYGPATKGADPRTIMIDATCLKAHRTACSLPAKKGGRSRQIGRRSQGLHSGRTCQRRHRRGGAAGGIAEGRMAVGGPGT